MGDLRIVYEVWIIKKLIVFIRTLYCMHLYGKPSNIVCNWVIYILCLDLFFPFFLAEKPKVAEKKYFIDTNSIHLPKSNMEMLNPVKDGMSKY